MTEKSLLKSPVASPETAAFWDAASEGTLLLGRCSSCANTHYYPRRGHCPVCGAVTVSWQAASGRGTLYSFVDVARGPAGPFTVAYVTLQEGCTIITHIRGQAPGSLRIGDAVQLRFLPTDGGAPYPVFAPANLT